MIVNELMNASQPSTYNVSDSNSEQLIRKHLLDMHTLLIAGTNFSEFSRNQQNR